jgi:hypothetical protein
MRQAAGLSEGSQLCHCGLEPQSPELLLQILILILSFAFGKLRTPANTGLRQTQDDYLRVFLRMTDPVCHCICHTGAT